MSCPLGRLITTISDTDSGKPANVSHKIKKPKSLFLGIYHTIKTLQLLHSPQMHMTYVGKKMSEEAELIFIYIYIYIYALASIYNIILLNTDC